MNVVVVKRTSSKIMRSPLFIVSVVLLGPAVLSSRDAATGSVLTSAILACVPFVFGAGVIGTEDGRGLLPLVLTRPISRARYVVSRVLGVLASAAVLYMVFSILVVASALLREEPPPWSDIVHMGAAYMTASFVAVAFLTAAATLVRRYYNIGCYALVLIFLMQGLGALVLVASHSGIDLSGLFTEGSIIPAIGRAFFFGMIGMNRSAFDYGVSIVAGGAMLAVASILFERRDIRPVGV